jgi:phosphopantothenoylcysteine decarboxylase/phosphopantothenate--cysteine ligase
MQTVTLIISGGIAAYKALELIRLLKKAGYRVIPVLTRGGEQFVTPLSASALAEEKAHTDLFSLTDEMEMGHIRLARVADLVVVAPASADLIAKIAHGLADDLASTLLLATDKPVLVAPAMNPAMWASPAVQANIAALKKSGTMLFGPVAGETACGEEGMGRMAEPADLFEAIQNFFSRPGPLHGKKMLVTAGPTLEPIDPVRFISNHSSGKQGYAIAEALLEAGADVTLISGPVTLEAPKGARLVRVQTADEMLAAVEKTLPVDAAICAAAVADWKAQKTEDQKIKKASGVASLALTANPDILAHISQHKTKRPRLVVGFAAQTQDVAQEGAAKRARKGCDWLLANDVSGGVFGGEDNEVHFITAKTSKLWPLQSKKEVAKTLAGHIAAFLV